MGHPHFDNGTISQIDDVLLEHGELPCLSSHYSCEIIFAAQVEGIILRHFFFFGVWLGFRTWLGQNMGFLGLRVWD